MVTHNIKLFYWDKTNGTLSTDASMLDKGGKQRAFGKVYQDACDIGFAIQGKKHTHQFVCEDENEHVVILKPLSHAPIKKVLVFKT
jgi:hypothetical protein